MLTSFPHVSSCELIQWWFCFGKMYLLVVRPSSPSFYILSPFSVGYGSREYHTSPLSSHSLTPLLNASPLSHNSAITTQWGKRVKWGSRGSDVSPHFSLSLTVSDQREIMWNEESQNIPQRLSLHNDLWSSEKREIMGNGESGSGFPPFPLSQDWFQRGGKVKSYARSECQMRVPIVLYFPEDSDK